MAKRARDRFDGFTVELYLDEDGDWLAHFVEMPNISAFASTPEKALDELEIAWDLTRESYRDHGEEVPKAPSRRNYSGQFNVRIDRRVHRALAIEAARAGVTLNALVGQKLAQSIGRELRVEASSGK
jgi:predicted HicB family RNase H-like nuclease